MSQRWFITGTDTEVGKTVASRMLLQTATAAGYRTAGYKPIASGCEQTPEGLRNSDALILQRASAVALDYAEVNPFAYLQPTSPHIAAAESQHPVSLSLMSEGLNRLTKKADWVLTEGAGGWYTPLSDQHTYADWVKDEQLAVILVVGMKLGCINHALLTAQAINQAGLRLAGWIANHIQPPAADYQAYLATLKARLPAPLLGEIPRLENENAIHISLHLPDSD